MKKHLLYLTFLVFLSTNLFSQNTWIKKADFPGSPRQAAFSFAIGNYGYVGGGEVSPQNYIDDFWRYDPYSLVVICTAPWDSQLVIMGT